MNVTDPMNQTGSLGVTNRHLDSGVLKRLLEDVGSDYAQSVIDAFTRELALQTDAIKVAGYELNPDAMADAAHRLKSTAASFGGKRLADVCVAIEQSASSDQMAIALDYMAEFSELAEASARELLAVRDELFGVPGN